MDVMKNNNQFIVRKLAKRSFSANKLRNIMAIIAITLTTILFTSLFTMVIGATNTIQMQIMRMAGGEGHAVLKYITDDQYNSVKGHPLIEQISYNRVIAESVDNLELIKRNIEMCYMDDTAMELGFCEPTYGSKPQNIDEIITDTTTLDLLGVPHEIGSTVSLMYTIHGRQIQTDFVLSGFWISDPAFDTGFFIVSKNFMDAYSDELTNTYKENYNISGIVNSYIMFRNTRNMEENLHQIITDCGYVWDDTEADNYIESNINWSYISASLVGSPTVMAGAVITLLLIMFTGYLIIYNIFQISVLKDIQFYGLLKTIGTTGKQLRHIIYQQAIILSVVGIPIGMFLGFLTGKALIPIVVTSLDYSASVGVSDAFKLSIFIGSALFALVTVFISVRKPGKIAAKVSPIEAIRYTENSKTRIHLKRSTSGGKINRMALSNLGRNKRRTVLIVISMTLSLVLLNSAYTLSQSFDSDKILSRFVGTDFLIGHANYFNDSHFQSLSDELSEQFIEAVQSQSSFEEGGRIYYNVESCEIEYDSESQKLDLYGIDDVPISILDVVDGESNLNILIEKMKTGNYILEGIMTDDYGNPDMKYSHFNVGDLITIHVDGHTYTYELLAKVKWQTYSTNRLSNGFCFYLPSKVYKEIVEHPIVMTYAFNVSDNEEMEIEDFVNQYTRKIEPLMNYESKKTMSDDFNNLSAIVNLVGGLLSFIIGIIGILNFTNSTLTSIITRQREFALLRSIGMTDSQLRKMLCLEGIYYAYGTILFSLLLSIIFSLFAIQGISTSLWFLSYRFILWPLFAVYPVLIFLTVVIPYATSKIAGMQSIIEQLQKT